MSVTTPSTGQKISDFSAGNVDANSYFIQANSGSTSKVSASQIGQFSNLNLLFSGVGGLDTTAKTIVGAINEVNGKEAEDIPYDNTASGMTATDVQAAIDEVAEKIEAIGGITEHDSPSISVSSGTFATLESFSVPKGTYIIITTFNQADSNQQGFRIGLIDSTETSANTSINSILATGRATIQKVRAFVLPSTTTIYIRAYQNSGSTINMISHTEIVRIK